MKSILLWGMMVGGTAFAGGVSGGGGNSQPAHPVTSVEVKRMIMDARTYVAARFNYLEIMADSDHRWIGHKDLPAKLFGGANPIIDWVERVPITINESGPCLDPSGNEMDGSATLDPPTVCLSVPRLTEKLSQEALRGQVVALALHEYSHLAGATEEEAEFLQSGAITDFLTADFAGIDRIINRAATSFYYLQTFAGGGEGLPPETPEVWAQLKDTAWEFILDLQRNVWDAPSVSDFAPWDSRLREYFKQTYYRLDLMNSSACAHGTGEEARRCQRDLERVFGSEQELDYKTYLSRRGFREFVDHPGVVFRRQRTLQDVQVELRRLKVDADRYVNYVRPPLHNVLREPGKDAQ